MIFLLRKTVIKWIVPKKDESPKKIAAVKCVKLLWNKCAFLYKLLHPPPRRDRLGFYAAIQTVFGTVPARYFSNTASAKVWLLMVTSDILSRHHDEKYNRKVCVYVGKEFNFKTIKRNNSKEKFLSCLWFFKKLATKLWKNSKFIINNSNKN